MKFRQYFIGCFTFVAVLAALPGYDSSVKMANENEAVLGTEIGDATFYAQSFQGARTACGLRFSNEKLFAAHLTYPFGTVARVTNLENGHSVTVVIVDRGPYGRNRKKGAIIDLSRVAAEKLGMIKEGKMRVKVDVLMWGNNARHKS